jgi:hypothetical protein
MKDLGELHHFLGITVERRPVGPRACSSTSASTPSTSSSACMADSKPCTTPVDTQGKVSSSNDPLVADSTHYRSLARALQYLVFTRSDIAYTVQ